MIYLGTIGRMVGMKSPSSQQLGLDDRYSFETTLEGIRKGTVRPIGRRSWALQTSDATTPAEQASLMGFALGEWGPGPFCFVSADAPVTNLLSPHASLAMETIGSEVSVGGPVELGSDGVAGASLNRASAGGIFFGADFVPVLAETPVAGSAWVQGEDPKVALYWYDASLSFLSASTSPGHSSAGMKRESVTAVPPANAVACRLVALGTIVAARPAITWTSDPFSWAAGEGCPRAVLHGVSKGLVMASADPRGGRYANMSYTVTEVG